MKKLIALALIGMAVAPAMANDYVGAGGSIPDFAGGTPGSFTRDIVVADSFTITDMSIMFNNLAHTWSGDLIITLTKVGDGTATILQRLGAITATSAGDSSNFLGTYTFQNSGANLWAAAAGGTDLFNIPAGTYANTGSGVGLPSANPGPAANNSFNTFIGQNSAGTWRVTITDNAGLDVGTLGSIKLTLVPTPGAVALAGLAGLAGLRRRRA